MGKRIPAVLAAAVVSSVLRVTWMLSIGSDAYVTLPLTRTSSFSSSFVTFRRGSSSSSSSSSSGHRRTQPLMLVEPGGRDALVSIVESAESSPSGGTATGAKAPGKAKRFPRVLTKSATTETGMAVRDVLSAASVPVAALAGFALTPSRRVAVEVVGAGISGLASIVGKNAWEARSMTGALPAVARLLLENHPFSNLSEDEKVSLTQKIQRTAVRYRLSTEDGDLDDLGCQIYKQYVLATCKNNPRAKTSELTELADLRRLLSLPNAVVGTAHAEAAKELYATIEREAAMMSQKNMITNLGASLTSDEVKSENEEAEEIDEEDEFEGQRTLPRPVENDEDDDYLDSLLDFESDSMERAMLDKCLWLSERALKSMGETPEAFAYEIGRVTSALKTPLERTTVVSTPFYKRALKSTRAKLETGQVTADMLRRARASLGISDEMASEMNVNCYLEEVRLLLGYDETETDEVVDDEDDDDDDDDDDFDPFAMENTDDKKFSEGDIERLALLQSVLEISDNDASYERATIVTPLFKSTIFKLFLVNEDGDGQGNGAPTPEEAAELVRTVQARKMELGMKDEEVAPVIESAVVQLLGRSLEKAVERALINDLVGVQRLCKEAVDTWKTTVVAMEPIKDTLLESCRQRFEQEKARRIEQLELRKQVREEEKLRDEQMRKDLMEKSKVSSVGDDDDDDEDEGGQDPKNFLKMREKLGLAARDDYEYEDDSAGDKELKQKREEEMEEAMLAELAKQSPPETLADVFRANVRAVLDENEANLLYKNVLARQFRQASVIMSDDDEEGRNRQKEDLAELARFLDISELTITNSAAEICGPTFERQLRAAAVELTADPNLDAETSEILCKNLVDRLNESCERYGMDWEGVLTPGLTNSMYRPCLETVAVLAAGGGRGGGGVVPAATYGIPTIGSSRQLELLRTELLKMEPDAHRPYHDATFGEVYRKSVTEAMGSTGIILEDYRPALDALKQRLDLSETEARKQYLTAMEKRLSPMLKYVSNELERSLLSQNQLSRRQGRDMGEDVFKEGQTPKGALGIGADANVMSEIMNVIDFYKENGIIDTDEEGKETYPLNAIKMGVIEEKMADALYRQFVVGGFQAPDVEQRNRYQANVEAFGKILGVDENNMKNVGTEIGDAIYDNYVTQTLMTKNTMDQQDMMFLADVENRLYLGDGDGDEEDEEGGAAGRLRKAQTKFVRGRVSEVFRSVSDAGQNTEEFTTAAIKVMELRTLADNLGLDLTEDLNVKSEQKAQLFSCEVAHRIAKGDIRLSADDDDEDDSGLETMSELQDAYGFDGDDAEGLTNQLVDFQIRDCIKKIEKIVLRGGDEETCLPHIRRAMTFGVFWVERPAASADDEGSLIVMEADAPYVFGGDRPEKAETSTGYRILNVYDASGLGIGNVKGDEEAIAAGRRLLMKVMDLTE